MNMLNLRGRSRDSVRVGVTHVKHNNPAETDSVPTIRD